MSKRTKPGGNGATRMAASPGRLAERQGRKLWAGWLVVIGLMAVLLAWRAQHGALPPAASRAVAGASNAAAPASAPLPSIEVAEALMVTVELDFGATVASIKEGLKEVERHHEPEDGRGRTFAILDAYGEAT